MRRERERVRGKMDRDRERVKGRGIERERDWKGEVYRERESEREKIERKRRFFFNYSKNLSNGEIKHKQRPDKKYNQKALHESLIPDNNLTQKWVTYRDTAYLKTFRCV